ncbi:MAG: hypothetical protein WCR27_08340 [Eubacteriales bacterium]
MEIISKNGLNEIIDFAIEKLEYCDDVYGCDLHNEVFNTDYFIIGSKRAEDWLKEHYGIFAAIDRIVVYEKENFGEIYTDLSEPEKVINMLVYIIGEEILQESETLREKWDERLTGEDIKAIIKELEELRPDND